MISEFKNMYGNKDVLSSKLGKVKSSSTPLSFVQKNDLTMSNLNKASTDYSIEFSGKYIIYYIFQD